MEKKSREHRTHVRVDYAAIEKNARALKSLLDPDVMMMAIVKSNAYGHGMAESARAALKGGASWLGVDEITEALELRKERIKAPILVLGYTLPSFYKEAAKQRISLTVSSFEALQNLAQMRISPKLRIHLKFDTGLHRQGIPASLVQQTIRLITGKKFPAIVEGAYTHFAAMEDPMREDYSRMQGNAFKDIVGKLKAKGLDPITHASASSGILFSKDFHFDMARAGIALYGLWPSPEIRKWVSQGDKVELAPALSWRTMITEIKLVAKGSRVGYDLTYETLRPSRLAVIPVGYWHGLPRGLSNKGTVLVGGKRATIAGRVSMDMTVIDVTDVPTVRPGDEVVLIGTQSGASLSAEEMADAASTINYEIVTRINPLLPRIKA